MPGQRQHRTTAVPVTVSVKTARTGRLAPSVRRTSLRHAGGVPGFGRWNGYAWEPHGFVANLAEAKRILYPQSSEPSASVQVPAGKPLGAGTGRHRKPQAPGPNMR